MTSTLPRELLSIGHLCGILQESPANLAQQLDDIQVRAEMFLNGIAYYDAKVIERLTRPPEGQQQPDDSRQTSKSRRRKAKQ